MSVVIRGMAMPKKCGECPIVKFDGHSYICRLLGYSHKASVGFSIRMTGCPLVELSEKHGRLIDESIVLEMIRKSMGIKDLSFLYHAEKSIVNEIYHAPTVIDAEGEE